MKGTKVEVLMKNDAGEWVDIGNFNQPRDRDVIDVSNKNSIAFAYHEGWLYGDNFNNWDLARALNPYEHSTGSGKKYKSAWHNGLRDKLKERGILK